MVNNLSADIQRDISNEFLEKLIHLIIYSFKKINKKDGINLEDQRRNKLLREIRKNKAKFKFNYTIAQYESADEDGITLGRTDITVFLDQMADLGVTIECKRFLKTNICKSYIENEYIENGINRFKNHKYPLTYKCSGMLSFVESGNYDKLFELMSTIFNLDDNSTDYSFNYIAQSKEEDMNGNAFRVFHIILNFSH